MAVEVRGRPAMEPSPMILALLLACSGPRSAAELPPADAPPTEVASPSEGAPADAVVLPVDGAGEPGATPVSGPPLTPAQSYAGCQDRLEGPQAAGECTTDADCTAVGCSSEVCTTKSSAPDVMTTCEILPCFAAVDSCGCHEGACTWTLKSTMPTPGRLPLPAKQP